MLNHAQTSTILAALRFYQANGLAALDESIRRIASDDGTCTPLDAGAIDDLCEALNGGAGPTRLIVQVEGRSIRAVMSERTLPTDVQVFVMDYDTENADPSEITGITQGNGRVYGAVVSTFEPTADVDIKMSDVFGETEAALAA